MKDQKEIISAEENEQELQKRRPYAAHHELLIIGGGSAGLTVAARMAKKSKYPDIAVIEPSTSHYYQPLWTLVGGGIFEKERSHRPMGEVMPEHTKWIHDAATEFYPKQNLVATKSGELYSYDYLVVAPGIQIDWDAIPGLAENIGSNGICSNYSYQNVDYTYECLKNTKKGNALFTQPNTTIKCGGAPQKIMYLASDYFRKNSLSDDIDVKFMSAGTTIFGVEKFAQAIQKVVDRYGIETNFGHNLKELRPDKKQAVFEILEDGEPVDETVLDYEMIHVTPPQSAPDFLKESPLANDEGWVEVDKHTLQHVRYDNIFSLGDASSTPNAKTGAAVRKQAKVLTHNLESFMKNGEIIDPKSYGGYGSCPLVTGYGKLIMTEFDYDNNPDTSFPFNQAKERWSMYKLKTHYIPFMYWNMMLKGKV